MVDELWSWHNHSRGTLVGAIRIRVSAREEGGAKIGYSRYKGLRYFCLLRLLFGRLGLGERGGCWCVIVGVGG